MHSTYWLYFAARFFCTKKILVSLAYILFLDASKDFDKINHWVLFNESVNRGVLIDVIKVLCYWYQHQSMYVKWRSNLSSKFKVTNVYVKGVSYPHFSLISVYVNKLSELMTEFSMRENLGGTTIKHMLYADDICILSLYLHLVHNSYLIYAMNDMKFIMSNNLSTNCAYISVHE